MVKLSGQLAALIGCLAGAACSEVPRTYTSGADVGHLVFRDDFSRETLGDDWQITGGQVALREGALEIEGARNHPVWLRIPHPEAFVIDFDAWPLSASGDIKVEVAGDGHSVASTTNYVASGYVVIFGGWDNRTDVIARRDEHGSDRIERASPTAQAGRKYHFRLTRLGRTLSWQVDGKTVMTYHDDNPLLGPEQNSFAFSGWDAKVRFDNLQIHRLGPPA